ncbi:Myb-like DNA-binding domain containing protein [Histomonas meleagridis]|uniref:Myb-like DNA-binding domain containing protein n=1 Tax=Histomonas meleagridis TaxID=135588 RepID=UPI00355A729F|nr:Myb-like DNA-binding domain containing protein [Histomonas meleagridis]KAH0801215.1 Myb-like DNA-binding domain containing protein [Histomonas meleagridis]
MANTIRAILNISVTFFPMEICENAELIQEVKLIIERFLKKEITYTDASNEIYNLTGNRQAMERLNAILNTGSNPIPFPEEFKEQSQTKRRHKTRQWTSYEDQRLLAGIYKFGIENWTAISKFVGNGRTRSQCSQRWYRGLNPSISKDQWTKAEEDALIDLVQKNSGKSWNQIATKLGNRSDVQCRYKYNQLQKEREKTSCPLTPLKKKINNEVGPNKNDESSSPIHPQPVCYTAAVPSNQCFFVQYNTPVQNPISVVPQNVGQPTMYIINPTVFPPNQQQRPILINPSNQYKAYVNIAPNVNQTVLSNEVAPLLPHNKKVVYQEQPQNIIPQSLSPSYLNMPDQSHMPNIPDQFSSVNSLFQPNQEPHTVNIHNFDAQQSFIPQQGSKPDSITSVQDQLQPLNQKGLTVHGGISDIPKLHEEPVGSPVKRTSGPAAQQFNMPPKIKELHVKQREAPQQADPNRAAIRAPILKGSLYSVY